MAGPVYAAAVILNPENPIEGLNDSKKLSEKKREALFDEICQKALGFAVCSEDAQTIDTYNILNATMLAMRRAIESLPIPCDFALIDGNRLPKLSIPAQAIIKGDSKSASIMAASILAKVSRDRFMKEMDEKYPQYQFIKHKGYGTKLHYQMLREFGPSPIHRTTFLKKMH